jgi:LysM repeat protein
LISQPVAPGQGWWGVARSEYERLNHKKPSEAEVKVLAQELQAANPNIKELTPGMRLRVPDDFAPATTRPTVSPLKQRAATPEFQQEIEKAFPDYNVDGRSPNFTLSSKQSGEATLLLTVEGDRLRLRNGTSGYGATVNLNGHDPSLPPTKTQLALDVLRNRLAENHKEASANPPRYVVRRGDDVVQIASDFGLTEKELLELNPSIKKPGQISAGQVLTLGTGG